MNQPVFCRKTAYKSEKRKKIYKNMGVGKHFCSFVLGHKLKLIGNVSITTEM